METTKKPDKKTLAFHAKLEKAFPSMEDKWSILSTALGSAEALGDELMKAFEVHQLSPKAKYAIIQYHSLRVAITHILQDKEGERPDMGKHMPIHDWDDEIAWEKKYIFAVKTFYEHLKREGKI